MYENLRAIMKMRGLSQNRLAMDARIAPSELSKAINGKIPWYPKWRKGISDALGIPENELFNEGGENEKK